MIDDPALHKKLLDRIGVQPVPTPRASTGALGDWFAALLHTRRGQFVLAVSRVTLQPVVVSGRDLRSFPARLTAGLIEALQVYGVPSDAIERERFAMAAVEYARTDDRSTVGDLTDLQYSLRHRLEEQPELSLKDQSLLLAETPIIARNLLPNDATCRVFGVALECTRFS